MDERIREIEEIKKYIKGEYEICGERASHHTEIQRLETLLSRIKELEDKIQLAEATRDDALAYARGYKERIKELEDWLAKKI